jgi:HK97 family phage portal protein
MADNSRQPGWLGRLKARRTGLMPFGAEGAAVTARDAAEQVALAAAGPGRAAAPDPNSLDYEACYARCDDVYAAVSLLADNAAQVPFVVTVDGRHEPDHPLARLLASVNPFQGATEFWTRAYSFLWLTGECFVLIERNDERFPQRPNELWAFSGRVIEPVADPRQYLAHYRFRPPGQGPENGFRVTPRDVVPLLLFHPGKPLRGLSPLSALRLALSTELHAKKANLEVFANGLMADVAISFDFANDEQRQRTREALRQAHVGDGRRHGFLVLEKTTAIEKLSLSPRDAEFIELDKLTTRDVAKSYRIPPMFLGQMEYATLRNYETGYRALWELAILPRVRQVATALTEHLGWQYGPGVAVEPDTSGIAALRMGDAERAATFKALSDAGLDPEWAGRRVFGTDWEPGLLAHSAPDPARTPALEPVVEVEARPTPPAESLAGLVSAAGGVAS